MKYLNGFNQHIKKYENQYPLPRLEQSILRIEEARKRVEEKLKDAVMGEPNPELVQQTIEKFFCWAVEPSTEDFSWLEVALLCRGLLVKTPEDGFLMESEYAVKVLLRKFSTQYQSQMLSAYALCYNKDTHEELETTVVSLWKSPSLEIQRNWERVTLEAKRMVQHWLARKDINDVLGELVDDNRRYEFWLQFLDQIGQTFVWLGSDARKSFPHLLLNRQERCAVLNHPGKPDNNVIMMRIGDVFIIESGARAGGKCWAYREGKMRPLLQESRLSYDVFRDHQHNLFKTNWGESDGLTHTSGSWEKTFQNELTRLHIEPDTMTFDEIIHRYQLRVETLPSGAERIRHNYAAGMLADLLDRHGFKDNHEGFYLNPHNMGSY